MSGLQDWLGKLLRPRPAPQRRLRILAVSIPVVDRVLMEQFDKHRQWELKATSSASVAFQLAQKSHFGLILCDRNQRGYPWREVIGRLAQISPRSCILLVAPTKIDYLWQDVIQQGGYDVLTRPFGEAAVLQAVGAAVRIMTAEAQAAAPPVTK